MNEELKVKITADASDYQKKIKEAQQNIKTFAEKVKDAAAKAGKAMVDAMKKIGTAVKDGFKKAVDYAAKGAAAISAAVIGLVKGTEEYRNSMALLETAFESAGGSAEVAKNTYNDLYRVLGDSGQATEAAQHLAKLTTEEEALAEWTRICQGVYGEFSGSLPIEGLTEAVNHTAKLGEVQGVLADALEWSGVNVDSFNASLAACNTEAEREALIRETLSGYYSEAANLYEENNQKVLAQREAQAKLTAALATLGDALSPIITLFTDLAAQVIEKVSPYIQQLAETYIPILQEKLGSLDTILAFVKEKFGEIKDKVGEFVEKIEAAQTWLAEHETTLGLIAIAVGTLTAAVVAYNIAQAIANAGGIAAIASNAALTVGYYALAVAQGIATAASTAFGAVMAFITSPITLVVVAIGAVVAIVYGLIKVWQKHKDTIVETWNKIIDKVKAAIAKIVGFFNSIIDFVKNNWQGLLLLIVNPFAGAFKLAYDNCESFRNKVNDIFNKIKSTIKNVLDSVKNTVSTIFSNIKNTITEKIESAKNTVKNVIEAIKGFFNFKFSWPKIPMPHFSITPSGWKVGDLLKGSIPRLGISWYAKGGVFDKPTLFNYSGGLGGLGENGAEAVVPLEKNTEWLDKIADRLAEKQGGNRPVYLMVDKTVLGQVSAEGMNEITRMTGKLPIKVM